MLAVAQYLPARIPGSLADPALGGAVAGIVGDHRRPAGPAGELHAGDPRSVGRYLLLGRLGSGGMGEVFLGRSPGGRLVAVKVVRSDLAGQAEFRTRFAREVAAARTVSGLFTAPVVDADPDAPVPWLATAYVPGLSLADTIARHGPLPVASVLALAAGLAEGLAAIHAAGIVHRDLKPSNVLLAEDGPRIIDFGISQAAEATMLTGTGLVFGSPAFMSPEQAQGHRVGPASDVFSLGAVLTFAATGRGPFGTASSVTLLYRVVFTPADTTGLPAGLRPLVERCLAKDPEQRPSAEELLAGLDAARPESGWLPAPITGALAPVADAAANETLADSPGPTLPPPATRAYTPGGHGQGRRPGRSRLALAGAAAVAVALIAAYLVVAMTGHLPPFGRAPAVPSSPGPATSAPSTPGPRPSPSVSSPASSPATSPASSPATSPVTSPASSPATSPVTSPASSPATSPASSPGTSPATSPAGSPATSPAGSPGTSPATSLAASSATSLTSAQVSSPSASPP